MFRAVLALAALALPAVAAAEEVTVSITAKDCARLLRHQPAADVAYQPGVGVKGRKVAPADLPGSGNTISVLPEVFEIPITISPVGWVERNAANKKKATAETGLSDTYQGKVAAERQLTTLGTEKTTLDTKAATLATEKATLDAAKATADADLAALQAQVDAGTRSYADVSYVRARRDAGTAATKVDAKQAEIDSNAAALTANATAQATQQAIIDAAAGKTAGYTADKAAAEATLSGQSARGLDQSTMKIGTFKYDTLRGTFTFNDQPIGSAEEQAMAEACAKRGVK
ncbi:MAG TPA: hypothetical protein VLL76_07145 [Candidatus Omnitrophota bacterium]|nr:hypothetical protein [Candidatus Omnitrophota bacterium]